jgi:hypothetical protein
MRVQACASAGDRVDARARDSADSGDFYFVDAADVEKGVRKLLTIVQSV